MRHGNLIYSRPKLKQVDSNRVIWCEIWLVHFFTFFFPGLVICILGTDWVGWIALNARHWLPLLTPCTLLQFKKMFFVIGVLLIASTDTLYSATVWRVVYFLFAVLLALLTPCTLQQFKGCILYLLFYWLPLLTPCTLPQFRGFCIL